VRVAIRLMRSASASRIVIEIGHSAFAGSGLDDAAADSGTS
jgi:hypothetical protein